MKLFGKKKRRPTRDEIERKVDEIERKGDSDAPIEEEDVTGVYDCVLERMRVASDQSSRELLDAARKLDEETERTRASTHPEEK